MDVIASRHLASTLSTQQLKSLALLLDNSDWTSEVRTALYDALMGAGRREDADDLVDPYIEGANA
ncbi:hypothetical protein [Homoserinimonas hongtaonis]|uniref:Uncharacterized protein n=1 Tax=Homoserinimonas hongtaonis TaxID=2079791 RepID=A0A2U1SZK6_9MICO|nr:hypothetical protein [Salinibacterium hongtaonis]PWB97060.1 hypothetical protein DF220_03820 [Salinibacterium hongtaonis]